MKLFKLFLAVSMLVFFVGCNMEQSKTMVENPPAEGFDETNSDPKAIALADSVMIAMGGRAAWDATNYIKWNFFGSRRHVWNKSTGDVVIEGLRDTFLVKMNINDMTGDVIYRGLTLSKADSLDQYLDKGKNMWINDAYWLIMPYKLKDSGVTLKYMGQDVSITGAPCDVIQLTFKEVGKTPNNRYLVYIDKETNLVNQWDFYPTAQDTVPRFAIPWTDYKKHGDILLSGHRGDKYELTEIAVGDSLSRYFN